MKVGTLSFDEVGATTSLRLATSSHGDIKAPPGRLEVSGKRLKFLVRGSLPAQILGRVSAACKVLAPKCPQLQVRDSMLELICKVIHDSCFSWCWKVLHSLLKE